MKPPPFDYARPASLAEATSLLAADEDAKLLAGGQSLVPLLNLRLARPSLLVDLARVPGLDGIERADGALRVGAFVRQRDAELSPVVAGTCPLLVEALGLVAHPTIRHRGTVGGSLAHADAAAELPAVAVLLDGTLHATGPGGARTLPAADFFRSHMTTALAQDEVLTAVTLPAAGPRAGAACRELTRRPGDYPLAGAAAHVELADDGTLADVRLVFFAVGDRPVRGGAAEERLRGARPAPGALAEAARAAAAELEPGAHLHATPAYRRRLAAALGEDALAAAVERAGVDA